MGRSISSYEKDKIFDVESPTKRNKNKILRKKSKNNSKWGRDSSLDEEHLADTFVLRSSSSLVYDGEGVDNDYYSWE